MLLPSFLETLGTPRGAPDRLRGLAPVEDETSAAAAVSMVASLDEGLDPVAPSRPGDKAAELAHVAILFAVSDLEKLAKGAGEGPPAPLGALCVLAADVGVYDDPMIALICSGMPPLEALEVAELLEGPPRHERP